MTAAEQHKSVPKFFCAGHAANVHKPDEFNLAVLEFLDTAVPESSPDGGAAPCSTRSRRGARPAREGA